MYKYIVIRLLVIAILILIAVVPVSASHLITFVSPTITNCDLTGVLVSGTVTVVNNADVSHSINGTVHITFVQLAGNFVGWQDNGFTTGSYPYTFIADMTPQGSSERYILEVVCTGVDTGTVSFYEVVVPPAATTVDEIDTSPQRVFFDNRINDFDTGNSVVLYGRPDSEDNWRLEVYNADESGLLVVVSAETIAAVPECPESNTLIYRDELTGISLWRLPQRPNNTCPFQLNAPSTEPGKTYVIIFDTLYPSTYYESGDEWLGQ